MGLWLWFALLFGLVIYFGSLLRLVWCWLHTSVCGCFCWCFVLVGVVVCFVVWFVWFCFVCWFALELLFGGLTDLVLVVALCCLICL